MKRIYAQRAQFICKSLLWSALLYSSVMIVIEWRELKAKLKEEATVVKIIHGTSQPIKNTSYNNGNVIKTIWLHILRSHL